MGPFDGVKVVEIVGLAPVPHCGLVLADFGADVTVVKVGLHVGHGSKLYLRLRFDSQRISHNEHFQKAGGSEIEQRLSRGKKSVTLDFKSKEDLQQLRSMCLRSDVVLDPFRPGVLEGIGLDPVELLKVAESVCLDAMR